MTTAIDATTETVSGAAPGTIHGRIDHARVEFTPTRIALGIMLVAALGFALLFIQEPMVHDSMHSFRHAAGVTCH
ncbi:CbtB domain-containing protein [Halopenitus sp. H-Gu1]|uniref:CbtB domain-containing protein n=1 Tax=Halopenitus sp. H-Gu1 TaxID=3242697 RepID=UPI00359E2173